MTLVLLRDHKASTQDLSIVQQLVLTVVDCTIYEPNHDQAYDRIESITNSASLNRRELQVGFLQTTAITSKKYKNRLQ
jgi:hypothetical protein